MTDCQSHVGVVCYRPHSLYFHYFDVSPADVTESVPIFFSVFLLFTGCVKNNSNILTCMGVYVVITSV